ncbi:MAG: hypothetical protein IKY52_03435, partial [Clostridia bacterium]|nr:hypothetical protein [Clostridia bacterium]
MLKLPNIFASGSLFQQNADLTISGHTDAGVRTEAILQDHAGHTFSRADTEVGTDGTFSLALPCPSASLKPWTITVSAGEERYVISDILFGEVWLASGQSNMELSGGVQPDGEAFFSSLGSRRIRVYHVYNIDGNDSGIFPYDPSDAADGKWFSITDRDSFACISAAGCAFSKEIYDWLKTIGSETPVGFINASWGGTGIRSWIPRTAMDQAGTLLPRLKELGLYPDAETWNTRGNNNAQQPTCQYNWKVHCLKGLKFRGILWYQGEYECWDEPYWRVYKDCLYLFYDTYRELFAADSHFPMLCVLLYPFPVTEGDCYLGYVNQNFIDAATERPDAFHIMPINDLPPVWNFTDNHPIHPTHKFEVGRRLAMLASTVVYGKAGQTNPAVMDGYEISGSRILIHFTVPGQAPLPAEASGIRIGKEIPVYGTERKKPIGLYICGKAGTYVPAECDILSQDTIALSHPGIEEPVHAAYGYNSMETGCNLWFGAYPAAFFRTNAKKWNPDNSDELIRIECKPWCDPTRVRVWTDDSRAGYHEPFDVFYRPVWKPCAGCEVVHDDAFTLDNGSIRIALS